MMHTYVFDIDGTLSHDGKKVNDTLCRRISRLSLHHPVIFASARPIRDMLPMLSDELHSSLFIGCNGGMAWKEGQTLFSALLEPQFVTSILMRLNKRQIPYVLDGEWNYALSSTHHTFHDYIRSLHHHEQKSHERKNHEISEQALIAGGVMKILILSDQHKADILAVAQDENVSVHTHRHDNFYDFTAQGNNKYRTLSTLIGTDKYIAFGNDQNDFLMLEKAEIAVFIGDQHDFKHATYYASTEDIPTLLDTLEI